jgi:hypothetical protein
VFASNDGGAHLNLITCAGEWNKGKKSYSERLVVFADKVEEKTCMATNINNMINKNLYFILMHHIVVASL